MTNHTLKLRALNRATLARQMLLEREAISVPAAIERLAGLQSQLAPAPYVGLWARLRDFQREDLAGQIESRKVIKATFIRATLHLVTAEDYLRFRYRLKNSGRNERYIRTKKQVIAYSRASTQSFTIGKWATLCLKDLI